jgi:hypothetical protein
MQERDEHCMVSRAGTGVLPGIFAHVTALAASVGATESG